MSGLVAVLLAGDRGPGDPVALATGSPCKALSPVGGRALVLRALDTLEATPGIESIVLCGPKRELITASAELEKRIAENEKIRWVEPGSSPATSAAAALTEIDSEDPCLVTTADHALLSPALLAGFLEDARRRDEDAIAGLATLELVHGAFPDTKRTAFRLRDGAYCGCNLFLMRGARGRQVVEYWKRVESLRKKPWRIASLFGPRALFGLLFRRLDLDSAMRLVSEKIGARCGALLVRDAELAVDVDNARDIELVERILAEREA